jgi:hypothetical protein
MRRVHAMTSRLLAGLGLAVLVLATAAVTAAQESPVFHGFLTIRRAAGTIDPTTGVSSVNIRRWSFLLTPNSNGMQPDVEPIIVAVGDAERLVLPAGSMAASKNGRKFTFQDKTITRGIRAMRIWRGKDPTLWQVRVQLVGIDLSALTINYPDCLPMAVIVGDDDGFSGVEFNRVGGFTGKGIRIVGFCPVEDWPWT